MAGAVAVSVAVNVSCNDGFKICLDESHIPVLSCPLSIKIPIHGLLSGLADFQKLAGGLEAARPTPKAVEMKAPPSAFRGGDGASAAVAAAAPGLQGAPAAAAAAVAAQAAAAAVAQQPSFEQGGGGPVSTGVALPLHSDTTTSAHGHAGKIDWETSITELQPNHWEYVEKNKWKAIQGKAQWLLRSESCLRNLKPRHFNPPRPVKQLENPERFLSSAAAAVSQPPPASAAPGPPPPPPNGNSAVAGGGGGGGAEAGPEALAAAAGTRTGEALVGEWIAHDDAGAGQIMVDGPGPNYELTGEFGAGGSYGPPPPGAAPPPPGAGAGHPTDAPPGLPPPGLPVPGEVDGTEMPPGAEGEQAENASKECKQQ